MPVKQLENRVGRLERVEPPLAPRYRAGNVLLPQLTEAEIEAMTDEQRAARIRQLLQLAEEYPGDADLQERAARVREILEGAARRLGIRAGE